MIFALDIETIPNPATFEFLPEPECTDSRIKDPVKITAHIEKKRLALRDKAGLDPLTGRVCAIGYVGVKDGKEIEHVDVIDASTDEAETIIIQAAMTMLGKPESRIVTWNGIGFDLPYIYKRAMILGVNPANFGAPPLSAWTKRYRNDLHFDLMQIWLDFGKSNIGESFKNPKAALNYVASLMLSEKKIEIDFTTFVDLILTEAGRVKLGEYCLQDTRLTWGLFGKMNGTMFV